MGGVDEATSSNSQNKGIGATGCRLKRAGMVKVSRRPKLDHCCLCGRIKKLVTNHPRRPHNIRLRTRFRKIESVTFGEMRCSGAEGTSICTNKVGNFYRGKR